MIRVFGFNNFLVGDLNEDVATKNFVILYALLIITLPFSMLLSNIILVLTFIKWLFHIRDFRLRRTVFFYLTISIFIIYVFGILNSKNLENALFNVEKHFPFLVCPIVLFSVHLKDSSKIYLLKVFYFTITIAAFYSFSYEVWQHIRVMGYLFPINMDFFRLSELTQGPGLDPPYFGLYISFSLIIGSFLVQRDFIALPLFLFTASFLIIFLMLSGARTSTVASFLSLFLFWVLTRKRLTIFTVTGILLLGITFIIRDQRLFNRFKQSATLTDDTNGKMSDLKLRVTKWKISSSIFFDNPVMGVGTGDAQSELNRRYTEIGFWEGLNQNYNCHNQFLQTAVTHGVLGLIPLLGLFLAGAHQSIKFNDWVAAAFLLICGFTFMTESVLERQKGILFFSFFYCLLMSKKDNSLIN